MRIAFAIPPTMTGAPAATDAQAITATAFLAQAAGHEVTLLLPCDAPSLMLDVRYLLGKSAVQVRTFELPPGGKDAQASDQACSLIWTRLLLDLDSELVFVFHDICGGRLRCTESCSARRPCRRSRSVPPPR